MLESFGEINLVSNADQEETTSETYIILTPTSNKGAVSYKCGLCNVKLYGEHAKILHLTGKKHNKNLKNKQKIEKFEKIKKDKIESTNKELFENITAVNEKASKEILSGSTSDIRVAPANKEPFQNILYETSKIEMTSVDKTINSLSLKRHPTFNSNNQDYRFANKSDNSIPVNNAYDFRQNFRTRGNKWNHNNNSWNNNGDYYGYHTDKSYYDFSNKSYHQYQREDQQHFYQNESYTNDTKSLPTSRRDKSMKHWKSRYFSESGPHAGNFNNKQNTANNHFNVDENEVSNFHNQKLCNEELNSAMHSDNDNLSTKNKLEKEINKLVISGEDFNSNEHSTSKGHNSPLNSFSPRVVSVPKLAHAKADSPRQLRSSKKGNSSKKQNDSDTIPNNNTRIESSNDSDKQQDNRLPPENMSDRISHLLNPLNSRDKAEIDKLLNNYSKSKKKETLLKLKHRSEDSNNGNNENLFHNLEELTDRLNTAESELEQNNSNSPDPFHCLDTPSDCLTNSDKISEVLSPKRKRRKKSNLSESSCNSLDVNACSRVSRKSSVNKDMDSNKKKGIRRCRASIDSCISTHKPVPVMEYETNLDEQMVGKRRSSLSLSNKSKKHKCSGSECAIECAYETKGNREEPPNIQESMNNDIYDASYLIKVEARSLPSQNDDQIENSQKDALGLGMIENAKILDVEDLMKMFAQENVTIKKEFDDPLIEAIKNVDVNFLMNVCDPVTATTNPSSSISQSPSLPSVEKNCSIQLNKHVVNTQSSQVKSTTVTNPNDKQCNGLVSEVPSQMQSVTSLSDSPSNNSLSPALSLQKQSMTNVCNIQSSNPENEQPSSISNARGVNQNIKQFETFESALPGLSPFKVYVNICNELNKLQKEEEEKRNNLKEVDKMIEQHQKILNELTASKIKLQIEEDNLINRRKTLTSALSQCVISDSYAVSSEKDQTSQLPIEDVKDEIRPIDSTLLQVVNQLPEIADIEILCSSSTTPVSNLSVTDSSSISNGLELQKGTINKSPEQHTPENSEKHILDTVVEDNEDIIIIPAVKKVVPVIDLVDSESPSKSKDQSEPDLAQNFSELIVHKTVVNCVKVHSGYLYTCSNDYTAKRFNLKDSKDTVFYQHAKRNVLQLCIETYSDTTIVFTLCSMDSRISSFKAKDGILLKTYTLESICAGISNGWGKVYAGLKSGLIVTCNRKDLKDLVRNLEPVKSLACTMQGGLRVVIILSISGQVAVRDVERNGLLIRYIKAHNDTPLFMNVYNDYVYLSSSVLLTATNLSTGNVEKKIKLTSPITGLAAFETNIFTTAFTGIVRCYHEGRALNMKIAYGAGRESLTCIYVYQGWVFTGNRNGVVSVFQFDPFSEYQCQVSNCKNVFMHFKDLDRHVNINSDHKVISKNSKCPWRKCQQAFNKDWTEEARKFHLKSHVQGLSKHNSIL